MPIAANAVDCATLAERIAQMCPDAMLRVTFAGASNITVIILLHISAGRSSAHACNHLWNGRPETIGNNSLGGFDGGQWCCGLSASWEIK
jgi:hypothetical protein